MVVGGFWLFHKGVISLTQVSQKEAVSVEFRKVLKLSSQYPALGFFIIGLVFIVSAAVFGKPAIGSPFTINGRIVNVADPDLSSVTIAFSDDFGTRSPSSDGSVNEELHPTPQKLVVQVAAPGYTPAPFKRTFDITNGKASLGEIKFSQVAQMPAVNKANIVELDKPLPTPSEGKY